MHKFLEKLCNLMILSICLLFVLSIWMVCLKDIVPMKRTFFLSYQSFLDKVGGTVYLFPKELPSEADNVKYYRYTGMGDKKTAFSFVVDNKEEYKELKDTYLSSYIAEEEEYREKIKQDWKDYQLKRRNYEPNEYYWYFYGEEVTADYLDKEDLNYLAEVFHDESGNYTMLAYRKAAGAEELFYLNGLLCNDDLNEIVMFGFYDVVRKENLRKR